MTAYALTHPNPRAKVNPDGTYWGYATRKGDGASGVEVIHSAEVPPDLVGPDWAAENTAAYFSHSDRPASYHDIADSDSIVHNLPYDHVAFHDATGTNSHSIGISMGTQAHVWGEHPDHDDAILRNAAKACADGFRYTAARNGDDPLTYVRWITPAQARARVPGLVEHGEMDPGRRSDPWTKHRLRPELRDRLLDYIAAELAGTTPPTTTKDEIDMADIKDLEDVVAAQVAPLTERIKALEGQVAGARKDTLETGLKLMEEIAPEKVGGTGRSLRKLAEMTWNVHHDGKTGKVRAAVAKLFGLDTKS